MFPSAASTIDSTTAKLGDTALLSISYRGTLDIPTHPNWEIRCDALEARILALEAQLSATPLKRLRRFVLALWGKCRNLLLNRRTTNGPQI